MRYPPHLLDEIRARLPASDVIGRRVRLKKAGREWRGLSPFNAEKTPSFYVNDQKQFYHCFSSGKHGDVFTFLMETEGLSFPEAVERLAGEAGVALPAPSEDARAMESRRRGAIEVMELAAAFYEEQLRAPPGIEARRYLDRRGLGPEIRARFRIGYAGPDRYGLRDFLAAKDVGKDLMAELGLLYAGEDVAVSYDRFRDRIMFPIADIRGRVIAFGGRAMQADAKAKYLNSPETPLFHKGQGLYNLHLARKAAHERGTIIAVEGYVDVIAMTMAGHANTVAPLGTALTEEQLGLLWRQADEPILCFDGDKAGQRAAFRALDLALPLISTQKLLRFAAFPNGQDPDDLFKSEGSRAVDAVLSAAISCFDAIVAKSLASIGRDTPEQRARFAAAVRNDIGRIQDNELKFAFFDEFKNKNKQIQRSPREGASNFRKTSAEAQHQKPTFIRNQPSPSLSGSRGFIGAASVREAMIVGTLLMHPEFIHTLADDLIDLDFEHPDARSVFSFVLDCAAEGVPLDMTVLENRLARGGMMEAASRIIETACSRERRTLDPHADPVRLEDALRQAMILHRKAGALHSELRQAERALVEEETEANFAWLCDVKARLAVVAGAEAEADVPETIDSTAP